MSGSSIIKSMLRDESGATAIEYGLIAALLVIAIVASMSQVANETIAMWDNVEAEVREAR